MLLGIMDTPERFYSVDEKGYRLFTSQQGAKLIGQRYLEEFTLLPTKIGENISVLPRGNVMRTVILYFVCINYLLYLN
jgi:hypothetical protein